MPNGPWSRRSATAGAGARSCPRPTPPSAESAAPALTKPRRLITCPSPRLERGSYPQAEDPPRREALHVVYRVRAEHGGGAVVGIAVYEEAVELREPVPIAHEE